MDMYLLIHPQYHPVRSSGGWVLPGFACEAISSNGSARVGTGQGSIRSLIFQGTVGYVTRMSGGMRGSGREAPSYPDWKSPLLPTQFH